MDICSRIILATRTIDLASIPRSSLPSQQSQIPSPCASRSRGWGNSWGLILHGLIIGRQDRSSGQQGWETNISKQYQCCEFAQFVFLSSSDMRARCSDCCTPRLISSFTTLDGRKSLRRYPLFTHTKGSERGICEHADVCCSSYPSAQSQKLSFRRSMG